jgi:sarcosine oxidase
MVAQPSIAVIGAGIVGLSTALAAQEAGASVTVFEARTPGNGQSAGESRIFRHAHDDRRLVEVARRSRAIWKQWEQRFETELVSPDGGLALGGSALARLAILNDAGGLEASEVDGEAVASRLPILARYRGPAMFDPEAGAIRTGSATSALAGALGDALVAESGEVLSLRTTGDGGAEVRSTTGTSRFDRVVVCAGAGTERLARGVGLELPVQLAAHVRLQFDLLDPGTTPLACLQDSSAAFGEEGIYAAPLPGGRSYAVGLSDTTDAGAKEAIDGEELSSLADRAAKYVARALPGLDPNPSGHLHCWVTTVPWSDDGFAAWQRDNITFVAGHNLFKQAPELGRMLAEAALGDQLDPQLRPEAKLGEG